MARGDYYWKVVENCPGIRANIYRLGDLIHPDSRCLVDESRQKFLRSEFTNDRITNNNDTITNLIEVEAVINGNRYRPLLEDSVYITGSTDGILDGKYEVKEYSQSDLAVGLVYTQLKCRYLGPKKPGDTDPDDNSEVVRWGSK